MMMQNNTTQPRAVIYTRVSDSKQIENNSLDFQKDKCKNVAKTIGYSIAKVFCEEGKSGKYGPEKRPEFKSMLEYIENNKVDAVLTHTLDRFSRDVEDTYKYLRVITEDYGIRYLAYADGLDSTKEDFWDKVGPLAVQNSGYSRMNGKHTRKGLESRAESCLSNGGRPPYGFKVDDETGMLVKDETTYLAVEKIFNSYANGTSISKIIKWLNENGYKTINQNEFSPNTINGMLHNEKYKGVYTWDKASPKNSKGQRNSHKHKENYTRIEGGCESIVDKEVFDRVQKRLTENAKKASHAKSKRYYPLTGHVFCDCGARMSGSIQYQRNKKKTPMYKCSKKCKNHQVNAEALEQIVFEAIADCLFDKNNTGTTVRMMNIIENEEKKKNNSRYQQLKSSLNHLKSLEESLVNKIENAPERVKEALHERLNHNLIVQEEKKQQIQKYEKKQHKFTSNDLIALRKKFTEYMMNSDTINTEYLINSLIKKVTVGTDTVVVELNSGISISRETKNIYKKEKEKMKVISMDSILTGIDNLSNDRIKCKFIIKNKSEINYNNNMEIDIPSKNFEILAKRNKCKETELVGAKFNIDFIAENGEISGIKSISKVA